MEAISQQIPQPFMRIDMLRDDRGLVLGEFTPLTGAFERFNTSWDRRLGEAWARAERRLLKDTLAGKRFDAFTHSIMSAEGQSS